MRSPFSQHMTVVSGHSYPWYPGLFFSEVSSLYYLTQNKQQDAFHKIPPGSHMRIRPGSRPKPSRRPSETPKQDPWRSVVHLGYDKPSFWPRTRRTCLAESMTLDLSPSSNH